jgi:hypothetical protein
MFRIKNSNLDNILFFQLDLVLNSLYILLEIGVLLPLLQAISIIIILKPAKGQPKRNQIFENVFKNYGIHHRDLKTTKQSSLCRSGYLILIVINHSLHFYIITQLSV